MKFAKPHPNYPLTPHPTGRWCKKIRGKIYYFGKHDEPDVALARYEREKANLLAGKPLTVDENELVVQYLVNRFLDSRQARLDAGQLSSLTLSDYHRTATRMADLFGRQRLVSTLTPSDFEAYMNAIRKTMGPHALASEVQRVKTMFRYGADTLDNFPSVRFGAEFRRPSKAIMRKARKNRFLEARTIHTLLAQASPALKAMILLGINCGFGNSDCAHLPLSAVDLKTGWVDFPRPKTGISRRAKLWPETVKALTAYLRLRPVALEHKDRFFITRMGLAWSRSHHGNPVARAMQQLTVAARCPDASFYALRHTFRTVADECRDQVAVNHVMGHADNSMAGVYRERIADERLAVVASTVHRWLFAGKRKS